MPHYFGSTPLPATPAATLLVGGLRIFQNIQLDIRLGQLFQD
jgi:hypothetical protein